MSVSKPPSINQDVRFYPFREDRIAHATQGKSVVYLNGSAQAVLDLCDGKHRADEICRVLSAAVGRRPQELHNDIAAALGCFAVEKLIRIENSILDELAPCRDAPLFVDHVRFGEYTLRVQSTCSSAQTELHTLYRHLLARAADGEPLNLDVIPISGSEGDYAFVHTGAPGSDLSPLFVKGNLDFLKLAVMGPLRWAATDFAWFHAGAVARRAHSVILTGLPGTGKSCITAELCRRGWDYLTDEILPISPAELCTLPYPVTPLPRRFADKVLPAHRLQELDRDFVQLPQDRICARPTMPAAIFFPRFSPEGECKLDRLTPEVAAAALLSNCTSVLLRGPQAIELVTRLVSEVSSFSLVYTDVGGACDRIEQLLAGGNGRAGDKP